ncbi:hypothetical protein TNCV_304621 [Trichonephila clavipes]|nr:hypothetical protein TNCV_304621 [Trichonephila clavipes]
MFLFLETTVHSRARAPAPRLAIIKVKREQALPWIERTYEESAGWNGLEESPGWMELEESAKERDLVRD